MTTQLRQNSAINVHSTLSLQLSKQTQRIKRLMQHCNRQCLKSTEGVTSKSLFWWLHSNPFSSLSWFSWPIHLKLTHINCRNECSLFIHLNVSHYHWSWSQGKAKGLEVDKKKSNNVWFKAKNNKETHGKDVRKRSFRRKRFLRKRMRKDAICLRYVSLELEKGKEEHTLQAHLCRINHSLARNKDY